MVFSGMNPAYRRKIMTIFKYPFSEKVEIRSANPEIREYRSEERKVLMPACSVCLIELLN